MNALAKSSSLAGNREGLFGRQNKASTAAQIGRGVVAGVEDSLTDLGAKLKHPMKSSSHNAVLSLVNQTKLLADPLDIHPAQDFKDGINRVKSAWHELSGMSLARKTEALTHGILDNAPYALAGAAFGGVLADVNTATLEQSIIRSRVEANVAKTRAASNTSAFKVLMAKENQFVHGYLPDEWSMVQLKKGEVLYGGLPGQSNYYTNIDAVLASKGSTTLLGRSLQIEPHPVKGFRPNIGEYVVARDIRVPGGIVRSNTNLGPGGTQQYFVDDYSNLLKLKNEYRLEELYENRLSSNIVRP